MTGQTLSQHVLPAPFGTDTYGVQCHPTLADVPISTMLTFSTVEGPTRSVMLTCRGITSTLDITPSPAGFEAALIGQAPGDILMTLASPTVPTTITNVGRTPISVPEGTVKETPPEPKAAASARVVRLNTDVPSHSRDLQYG